MAKKGHYSVLFSLLIMRCKVQISSSRNSRINTTYFVLKSQMSETLHLIINHG